VDETIEKVARRMADERVHRVIVVDAGGHPVGILTALDVLSVFPSSTSKSAG
jgi:CBS domain-containing protein